MNAFILRMAYLVRNFLARKMFPILRNYCQGEVLDVGGRIFYSFAKRKGSRLRTGQFSNLAMMRFPIQVVMTR